MKKVKLFLFIFICSFSAFSIAGNGKVSPNTAHLLQLLKEKKTDQIQQQFSVREVNNSSYINAFIELSDQVDSASLTNLGVRINSHFGKIITARIPVQSVQSVSELASVKYIQIGTKIHKKLDAARAAGYVDQVQAGTDLPQAYTGKDVVVGIIDNGFQYGHIDFYNTEGTATRIKRVWDQNATGTAPAGFNYGAEYSNESQILTAKYDMTNETHGTHVAGIAAGADKNNGNNFYGVATGSDLVFVSTNLNDNSTDNVSLSDGIKYIYDYATSVNKPCVVNLSYGSQMGPHDGTSIFDQVCDELLGSGRLLVGSAGNEGYDKVHVSKTFSSETDTLKTLMKFYNSSTPVGWADIWGESGNDFSVKVVIYNRIADTLSYSSSFLSAATENSQEYTLSSATGAVGKIYVYTGRNDFNNKPNATIYSELTTISSRFSIGIIITSNTGGTVHAWSDDQNGYFSNNSSKGTWMIGNSDYSIGEIGGTGKKIISVGAYTTKSEVSNIDSQSVDYGETTDDLCSFSSHGPTVDNRMKPDITAPGSLIVSSFSDAVIDDSYYGSLFVSANQVSNNTYYYGVLDGTSMSAPFVTGVLATWLEAKPDLTPEEVRTIFQSTSTNDAYTEATGNLYWGYGKINAWDGIKASLQLSTAIKDQTSQADIRLFPNPCIDVMNIIFSQGISNVSVTISNISGQTVMQKEIGNISAAQQYTTSIANLAKGVYIVKIHGAGLNQTTRIIKE